MTAWNMFVKKVYHEGHNKNKNYSFKQALKDASRRKGEMRNMGNMNNKTNKRNNKSKQHYKKTNRQTRRHH